MAAKKHPGGLTAKQEAFIDEYLVDLSATNAAIRAGYSQKTAYSIGHENLTKPEIRDAINERRAELAEKIGITQERVLREYARIAFLDPTTFFDGEGKLIKITELPKDSSAAIAGLDVATRIIRSGNKDGSDDETEYVKRIKLVDKKGALDALSRHLGLFEADNKQRGSDALAALLDKIASQSPPKPKSDDTDKPDQS